MNRYIWIKALALFFVASAFSGCATKSWTREQIETEYTQLNSDTQADLRKVVAQLNDRTEASRSSIVLIEKLNREVQSLRSKIDKLGGDVASFDFDLKAEISSQNAALMRTADTNNSQMHTKLTKEYGKSIEALTVELKKLEIVGKNIEGLSNELNRLLSVAAGGK